MTQLTKFYSFRLEGGYIEFAISPDSQSLAIGGELLEVRIYDICSGRVKSRIDLDLPNVWHLQYSSDGKLLIIGSDDKVLLWNTKTKEFYRSFPHLNNTICPCDLSSDNRLLMFFESEEKLVVYNVETEEVIFQQSYPGLWWSLFTPDGKKMLVFTSNVFIEMDTSDFSQITRLREMEEIILPRVNSWNSAFFSNDGRLLAIDLCPSGYHNLDSTILIYEMETQSIKNWICANLDDSRVSFFDQNSKFATGHRDLGGLHIWSLDGNVTRISLPDSAIETFDQIDCLHVVFSADDKWLVNVESLFRHPNIINIWRVGPPGKQLKSAAKS